MPSKRELADLLELAYSEYQREFHRSKDPVSLAHRFSDPRDREVAAFLSALLAYGNVRSILSSLDRIFNRLGPSPYRTIIDGNLDSKFDGFYHRFTTGDDVEVVCRWISGALRSHGSIEAYFVGGNVAAGAPMKNLLSDFVRRFTAQELPAPLAEASRLRIRNLKYLISDPERGSACKRLNLFLRWVVREEDGIDLGLWKKLSPRQLMLPVDTHLLQTLLKLRWTQATNATWKVVESATDRLRQYSPEDPIRYDFALCHLSMEGKSLHPERGKDAKVAGRPVHAKSSSRKL